MAVSHRHLVFPFPASFLHMTTTHSNAPAFSICVYCGSRPGTDAGFTAVAQQVGHWIGAHGGQLVYGGGRSGLMGTLANAALDASGRVIGVIPQSLVEREHANPRCTELIVVPTMHERKRIMAERSDAFLALPGGIGTLEEFFEIWTWRQLGHHTRPIGLLNHNGYYSALLTFLDEVAAQGFLTDAQRAIIDADAHWQPLLQRLTQS